MPTKIWNSPSKSFNITGFDDDYFNGLCDEWEKKYYYFLKKYIPAGTTILDVGANIGVTALAATSAVENVDVIAFEPARGVFELLQKNIEQNGAHNITPLCTAVGSKSTDHVSFIENSAWGSLDPARAPTSDDPPCITLDEFVIRRASRRGLKPVSFVKIDVEGFEMDVLQGMENLINAVNPIVQVEFNIVCLVAIQDESVHKVLEAIAKKFRYVYRAVAGSEERPIEPVDIATREGRVRYLFDALARTFDYDDFILSNRKLD